MGNGALKPILVDTSALVAICKTCYDRQVYDTLQMSTTNVCNEEIKRQKDKRNSYCHRQACERYLELLRENSNPDVCYVEDYKPHVENQGEQTLEEIFREYHEDVKYILLFDFDAIERFDELKREISGEALNTRIDLPNYAFERLRRDGFMTDSEYCKATYQMGVEEGWMKKHALKFDSVSDVDCPQFP